MNGARTSFAGLRKGDRADIIALDRFEEETREGA
jgi:hypothetical protein